MGSNAGQISTRTRGRAGPGGPRAPGPAPVVGFAQASNRRRAKPAERGKHPSGGKSGELFLEKVKTGQAPCLTRRVHGYLGQCEKVPRPYEAPTICSECGEVPKFCIAGPPVLPGRRGRHTQAASKAITAQLTTAAAKLAIACQECSVINEGISMSVMPMAIRVPAATHCAAAV